MREKLITAIYRYNLKRTVRVVGMGFLALILWVFLAFVVLVETCCIFSSCMDEPRSFILASLITLICCCMAGFLAIRFPNLILKGVDRFDRGSKFGPSFLLIIIIFLPIWVAVYAGYATIKLRRIWRDRIIVNTATFEDMLSLMVKLKGENAGPAPVELINRYQPYSFYVLHQLGWITNASDHDSDSIRIHPDVAAQLS